MDLKLKLANYLNSYLLNDNNIFKSKKSISQKNRSCTTEQLNFMASECHNKEQYDNINNFIINNKNDNTFQKKLFNYIDRKNLKDSDVYNKVNIDRRLFSKIRNDKNYHPSKETIILLAIALKLSETELEDLLSSASYSLPMNTTHDLIIRFCFKEKIYNLMQINEFLYDYNCKLLN